MLTNPAGHEIKITGQHMQQVGSRELPGRARSVPDRGVSDGASGVLTVSNRSGLTWTVAVEELAVRSLPS